jgi:hypothetical protein
VGDIYVYHFVPFAIEGSVNSRSSFAATLATIEKLGSAIMDSQIVVDASQINADGFLIPALGFGSHELTTLSAKIKTLELRAAARDHQAQAMSPKSDDAAIYMLSLESRHLRQKARRLMIERADLLASEADHISMASSFFPSRTTSMIDEGLPST